ncbi:MAG: CsgG/HfaB family protein [Oceanicaulis sp.]
MKLKVMLAASAVALGLSACATVEQPAPRVSPPTPVAPLTAANTMPSEPVLKHKIAIGRFSNATNYGRALLLPGERDPMADQVADMLMARLVDTGRFLVFEREDLDVVANEQRLTGEVGNLVGVDALIVGSVTEFGRRNEGQAGFLSSTMRQTVDAGVEVRLVDVETGLAFFSADGEGSATNEAGEVAGFGSRAGYDATLNDRAISAAVDDLVSAIVSELADRPWTTDILEIDGGQIFISGGSRAGLERGDVLAVTERGRTVTSRRTGLPITLPGEEIARIEIVSFFGDTDLDEGAVARIVSGDIPADADLAALDVTEVR